jgi:hypothetical protein
MFPPSEHQASATSLKIIEDMLSEFTDGAHKASVKYL